MALLVHVDAMMPWPMPWFQGHSADCQANPKRRDLESGFQADRTGVPWDWLTWHCWNWMGLKMMQKVVTSFDLLWHVWTCYNVCTLFVGLVKIFNKSKTDECRWVAVLLIAWISTESGTSCRYPCRSSRKASPHRSLDGDVWTAFTRGASTKTLYEWNTWKTCETQQNKRNIQNISK